MNNIVEPCSYDPNLKNKHNPPKPNTNFSSQSSIHRLFSPFLNVFLPIIGVQLNLSTIPIKKWMQIIYRYLTFCVMLIVNVLVDIYISQNEKDVASGYATGNQIQGTTSAFTWNVLVDYGSTAARNIGVQAILVFHIGRHWEKLKVSLDNTDYYLSKIMCQREEYYLKYRKLCFGGIVYIVTVVVFLIVASVWELFYEMASWYRILLDGFALFLFIYPISSLILFGLLCSLVSDQLYSITKLLTKISNNYDGMNQLKMLQEEHDRIIDSIGLINSLFGPILLLEIPFIFIGVIVGSVHLMVANMSDRGWTIYFLTLSFVSSHVVHLILISFSAEKIKQQARKLGKVLFQTSLKSPKMQTQIMSFAEQVFHLDPQITACGFFKIGKSLCPTLIGTTLTYFLITYQFHRSEINKE